MEYIVTQRVNEFRQSLGLSILAFSKEININQTTLNKQLKEGGCGVQVSTLTQILDTYPDLSAEWLLRGDGDMLKKKREKTGRELVQESERLIEQMKDHIETLKEDKKRSEKMLEETLEQMSELRKRQAKWEKEKTYEPAWYDSLAAER